MAYCPVLGRGELRSSPRLPSPRARIEPGPRASLPAETPLAAAHKAGGPKAPELPEAKAPEAADDDAADSDATESLPDVVHA